MIPGNLPAHMNPGRGTYTGPVSGGLFELSMSWSDQPLAADGDSEVRLRMPFDCRIHRISSGASAGTGSPSWKVENETDSTTIVADNTMASTTSKVYDAEQSSNTLSNVDVARGDILLFTFSSPVSQAASDVTLQITGWVKNHVHVSDTND